jgi:C-terminal processing protease CtpA/Prc
MKYAIIIISALFLTSSCEKLVFKDRQSQSPIDNFEYLWSECDQKYSYFELKQVDWNDVRSQYASMIYEGMSNDSLFNVLGAMLSELKDDHVNLFSETNTSFYGVQYTGQDNFDWQVIINQYLSTDFYITGPIAHDFLENEQIGYLRLANFSQELDDDHLDYLINRYQNTEGIILDLRENGGGKIAKVFQLLSRFVDESTLVSYSRIKSGPAHDDFTAPEPVYVNPYNGSRFSKKIVVLVDRGTYSSGSLFALKTKALSNMVLVGDTTGGGLGMPNGGQLPNGWTYRFSVTQSLTLDKSPEYENGVPPDIHVSFDWNNLSTDEILEQGIEAVL